MNISLSKFTAVLAKYLLSFAFWFKITFYASVAPGIILPAIVFQWNVK